MEQQTDLRLMPGKWPKWHRWSLRSGFVLMTLVAVNIRCLTMINGSVAGIFETIYLVTIGWDEFAHFAFK